jgi:hypothetical protein
MPEASFSGMLALESRHAKELERLILTHGGKSTLALAMRGSQFCNLPRV